MKRLLTLGMSALALATPAMAQDVTITNAKVVIGDGSAPIEGGTVVVQGGKVIYAGPEAAAQNGATVIDAKGAWVTPGLFATVTTLGLADVSAVGETNDITARGTPFSAALDASTAINPTSQHILVHKAAGITRAATTTMPSGSIFAGQGAIIDLDGDPRPVMQAKAFQMVNLGEGGADNAGGSRVAAHALLRAAASDARVDRIFVAAAVKIEMCKTATRADKKWLQKIRPVAGHDTHFHVRLKCPKGARLCETQKPTVSDLSKGGMGCDDTLMWWVTDYLNPPKDTGPAEKPAEREPTARELTLADLPAQCAAVLSSD